MNLTLPHPQDIRLDLKRFNWHFVTLMVVLKQFQKHQYITYNDTCYVI